MTSTNSSVQRAMDRGTKMYVFDHAAWITSDDLMGHLPIERQPEIGGWVVTPSGNGVHVDYFGKDASADRAVYSADVNGETVNNSIIYPATAEPTLTEPARSMAHALRAAWVEMGRHNDWRPCSHARFNTIVLPPEADGTVPVYFLTPQTEFNNFPFGGHYEVDIARDGSTSYARPFTNTCITMKKAPLNASGPMPVALVITHLLDAHPTEIHVFEQYYLGIPVVVTTSPNSTWKVDEGQIEDISGLKPK